MGTISCAAQMLLVSACALFLGCSAPEAAEEYPEATTETTTEEDDGSGDAPLNSAPPLAMDLCILFKDAAGRNLVQGLPTDPSPSYTRGEKNVQSSYYTLTTVATKPFKNDLNRLQTYYVGGGMRLLLPFFLLPNGINGKMDSVAFTATCPYVFGDEKPHTVVGYCNHDEFFEPYYTRVEVDGKEYPFERLKEEPSVFLLSVVLDR